MNVRPQIKWLILIVTGPLWVGHSLYRGVQQANITTVVLGCIALLLFAFAAVQIVKQQKRPNQ
jgi:hypothetical protein